MSNESQNVAPGAENSGAADQNLQSKIDSLTAENATLQQENQELIQALEAAKLQLNTPAEQSSEAPTLKVGKRMYRITAKNFSYKGETYTAADLQSDEKLAKKLVEIGAGFLEAVTE